MKEKSRGDKDRVVSHLPLMKGNRNTRKRARRKRRKKRRVANTNIDMAQTQMMTMVDVRRDEDIQVAQLISKYWAQY
jgi:hypothetical protein